MIGGMIRRKGISWAVMSFAVLMSAALLALFAGGLSGCSNKAAETAAQSPSGDQTVSRQTANTGTGTPSASEKALAEAKAASLPVLLNFHSTKCVPCIEIEKVIKEVEPEYAGRVAFIIVDVYDASEQNLCDQYGIQTIPTTVFLDAEGRSPRRTAESSTRIPCEASWTA